MLGSQLLAISTVCALMTCMLLTAIVPNPAMTMSRNAITAMILERIDHFESMTLISDGKSEGELLCLLRRSAEQNCSLCRIVDLRNIGTVKVEAQY